MRFSPAWRQLLIGISISRYLPPMGTAGFDRRCVSGNRRLPRPPPSTMVTTSFMGLPFYATTEVTVNDEVSSRPIDVTERLHAVREDRDMYPHQHGRIDVHERGHRGRSGTIGHGDEDRRRVGSPGSVSAATRAIGHLQRLAPR